MYQETIVKIRRIAGISLTQGWLDARCEYNAPINEKNIPA